MIAGCSYLIYLSSSNMILFIFLLAESLYTCNAIERDAPPITMLAIAIYNSGNAIPKPVTIAVPPIKPIVINLLFIESC